jgi:hypothetical protein
MVEVAYELKDYADYFVASQNISWAPLGPEGRYIETVFGIEPGTTPAAMATLLVDAYANTVPPEMHPYTLSAIDLGEMDNLAAAVDQLAAALQNELVDQQDAEKLLQVFVDTQKIDYDADLRIEPATDSVLDLHNFAENLMDAYASPGVDSAAQNLIAVLEAAVIAERHFSDSPWLYPDRTWDLENVHGLSIYLPLGEDLELPIVITETVGINASDAVTRNLRLRETYAASQLQFVADTDWELLIDTYYESVTVPPALRSVSAIGLLLPDYSPPQSVITVTGDLTVGETIYLDWLSTDLESGVSIVTLWQQPLFGAWQKVAQKSAASGSYAFTLAQFCSNGFAVTAKDRAGNIEILGTGNNLLYLKVQPCQEVFLPMLFR